MARGFRDIRRWAQREQMTSLRTQSQARGLTYSVLRPHIVLAAGVQESCLLECLRMDNSVIFKKFDSHNPLLHPP